MNYSQPTGFFIFYSPRILAGFLAVLFFLGAFSVLAAPAVESPDKMSEEVIPRENIIYSTKDKGYTLNVPNPVKADNLTELLSDVANFIFIIAIPIAVIAILISGIKYLTAGGNEDKIKSARQALIWTAAGLVIILIGKGIISVIQSLLSVTAK